MTTIRLKDHHLARDAYQGFLEALAGMGARFTGKSTLTAGGMEGLIDCGVTWEETDKDRASGKVFSAMRPSRDAVLSLCRSCGFEEA
jgi:hypothetical protein